MQFDATNATAVLSALRRAGEQGGPEAALRAMGIELPEPERFEGLLEELQSCLAHPATERSMSEALALGFLAGRLAHRPRVRTGGDPTSFVMDRELVVQGAVGESILRLPWFEDGLFVGRELPEIVEMPTPVRIRCVEHYSAALDGRRGRFSFTSYGHSYSVDAVPVYGDGGSIDAVLAIATPLSPHLAAAATYERTAERLDRSAAAAEQCSELHRVAGRIDAQGTGQRAADKARSSAARLRLNARCLRARATPTGSTDMPAITLRELDVIGLVSQGLTSAQIAEHLVISVSTVKTHLQNIYPKLGATDKASAVASALRHGLID